MANFRIEGNDMIAYIGNQAIVSKSVFERTPIPLEHGSYYDSILRVYFLPTHDYLKHCEAERFWNEAYRHNYNLPVSKWKGLFMSGYGAGTIGYLFSGSRDYNERLDDVLAMEG
jgi:hypothetical protein